MSQFIMFERNPALDGTWLEEMQSVRTSDFLVEVAQLYFPDAENPVNCAAVAGDASDFINEVCMRIECNESVESARIVSLVKSALEMKVGFVFWAGSDYMDLPLVGRYEDFLLELALQAHQQPADVFMKYIPVPGGVVSLSAR